MITVFGSVSIDITYQLRMLPSIGETVLTPEFTEAVGGKGANQAIATQRDDAATSFIGCIGDDAFGTTIRSALTSEGINVDGLTTVPGKSGLASIWIDGQGENMIAVASGANTKLTSDALASSALTTETLVILQMEVSPVEIEKVIARARQSGAKVLLNLAPALPLSSAALAQVDMLVLNEHEALTLCQHFSLTAKEPEQEAAALAEKLDATVIITLGPAGVVAMHEGRLHRAAALPVTPVDTTGAGDCFVGVLAAGLDAGLSFERALARAAVGGSLACTIVGAMPSFPSHDGIEQALAQMS